MKIERNVRTAACKKVLPKAGLNASIGHLCKVQHSFFNGTLVLKIPAFGNTQPLAVIFLQHSAKNEVSL